ncbi:MAG TPA: hypothetical protein PKD10_15255 [Paracoccaceae bacterium]|nr:hypothetical protein [Paracoccaceae bacterium]HMO71133.1 hypothetical protein [Paracoccaceae bacterium]
MADGSAARDDDGAGGAGFRRRVFYIPGYDPFHPRRYRELYRKEGAAQAALSGYELRLLPRRGGTPQGWRVESTVDGHRALAAVEVLVWSDLVRGSMDQGIAQTYGQLGRTAWIYIASGALFRLMRLRKGPVIAALYPVVVLLAQLGLALLAGWLAVRGLIWVMPGLADTGRGQLALLVVAGIVVGLVLHGFRRIDNRLMAHYLMHDFAYSAQGMGADPPDLSARIAAFGARIRTALAEDWDEVLVVGHSSGAHIGVTLLADLLRAGLPDGPRPALSFLTLGQVVPMVSFLPRADRLRADLALMSAQPDVFWVDVTAPGDGCSFALCDPVAVSGVAPPDKRWPLVVSAAFTQTLRPETWKRLRRRFFRLHFQYLCAFDALPGRPWDYDYFRITAGPRTLGDHFAGRPPSASRIERPVNRHTSMAA